MSVDPWPFEPDNFSIRFDYRVISQIQFTSSAEFRKAILQAEVTEKKWTLAKQKRKPLKKKKID